MPKGTPKNGVNKGWFKKGSQINAGRKRPDMIGNKLGLGKTPWNKGLKFPEFTGKNNPNWKGGIVNQNIKYKRIRTNNDYQLQHRKIMEDLIKRKLTKNEVIHHINGNGSDNRIENLMLFSNHSEHMKYEWRTGFKRVK